MYVILDAADAHKIINIKSSQNNIQHKAAKPKPILLDKAI